MGVGGGRGAFQFFRAAPGLSQKTELAGVIELGGFPPSPKQRPGRGKINLFSPRFPPNLPQCGGRVVRGSGSGWLGAGWVRWGDGWETGGLGGTQLLLKNSKLL